MSEVPLYACTRTEAVSKGLGFVVLGFRVLVEVLRFRAKGCSV